MVNGGPASEAFGINLDEIEAENEVIITFRTTVNSGINRVENQSFGNWDENGDGEVNEDDANVSDDDRATEPFPDPTVAIYRPETKKVKSLPLTGFVPGKMTEISQNTLNSQYIALQSQPLVLIIPSLDVQTNIVGVPLKENGEWDTAWLWNQAGYLSGTAFPTWSGNTALTGHSYLPNGRPGPFYNLSSLKWGNQVILQSDGLFYHYEVRERYYVSPNNLSPLAHEENDWLTLITCYQYDERTNNYRWRVVVKAVLVDVSKNIALK